MKTISTAKRRAATAELQASKVAAFSANKSAIWDALWLKVMRMALFMPLYPEFFSENDWICSYLRVNPLEQSFHMDGIEEVAADTLSAETAERATYELDMAMAQLLQYLEELERKRLLKIEQDRIRAQALSKLSEEEKEALGFGQNRR